MPEVRVEIGGRSFEVACQSGEEPYLRAAAALLDAEASAVVAQTGRIPETRMLLMAGLMLADKAAGHADQTAGLNARIAELEAEKAALLAQEPKRVEVPVVPASVSDALAELAARAEAMADQVDDKAGPPA